MKDIEYILATKTIPTYTREEENSILRKECELNGKNHQLTVAMEEFAELIEVICENRISGRVDLIHLKEELVDCWICLDYLSILFDINKLSTMTYYDDENCLNNCILNLSTAITKLSKCIRGKENADVKIVSVINSISETLYNIHKFYDIRANNLEVKLIRNLKIERCEQRNINKIKSRESLENTVCGISTSTNINDNDIELLSTIAEYTNE